MIMIFSVVHAEEKSKIFFFHWSVGTGAVIYGDDEVTQQTQALLDKDTGRFLLTGDVGIGIALDDYIRLSVGGLVLSDLAFNTAIHANHIDYGFFTGVRIYPNLAGLNFGMDYVLGARADFIKLSDQSEEKTYNTVWGNGFRLNIGYDFSYHGIEWAPVVEGSYRLMPRGGYYDNYFSLFLRFNVFI